MLKYNVRQKIYTECFMKIGVAGSLESNDALITVTENDKIEIEIENGGISLIKITDNGFGIEKSELKKAI